MRGELLTLIIRSNAKDKENLRVEYAHSARQAMRVVSAAQWSFSHSTTYKQLAIEAANQDGKRLFFWLVEKETK